MVGREAERVGGHGRGQGHRVGTRPADRRWPGPRPWPLASDLGVGGAGPGRAKDWAGLRAATESPARRQASRRRAETQVLPTSVPVPATRTTTAGRGPVTDPVTPAGSRRRPPPGLRGAARRGPRCGRPTG